MGHGSARGVRREDTGPHRSCTSFESLTWTTSRRAFSCSSSKMRALATSSRWLAICMHACMHHSQHVATPSVDGVPSSVLMPCREEGSMGCGHKPRCTQEQGNGRAREAHA